MQLPNNMQLKSEELLEDNIQIVVDKNIYRIYMN